MLRKMASFVVTIDSVWKLVVIAFACSTPATVSAVTSNDWTSGTNFPSYRDETTETYTTAFINVTYFDHITGHTRTEKTESGKFGEAHVGVSNGVLIHVKSGNDNSGCTLPFENARLSELLPTSEPWIALVKRGGCNFQVKVDNAYRSNASAVIVYNDRESNILEKMKLSPIDNTPIVSAPRNQWRPALRRTGSRPLPGSEATKNNGNISAVFTYKWKGEELAKLIENGTRIMAQITIANHCTRPFANINRSVQMTSVLFVSISFIVLMVISLAWLVFYYVQRFRYIHAKDRLSRRLCSAAKKALSKIPTKHIRSDDKEMQGDGECCAICIEPYRQSDVVRILPCRHEFHRSCIDPWLLEHRTCPMCKMDILKHYGFIFTGSQESILHMDIEEAVSDSESLQHRSLSPVPHIRPSDLQSSSSGLTPDILSRTSRSTTPDELTPALAAPGPSTEPPRVVIEEPCGPQMVMSTSEFLSAKTTSQLRRSISLDNCELISNSQH